MNKIFLYIAIAGTMCGCHTAKVISSKEIIASVKTDSVISSHTVEVKNEDSFSHNITTGDTAIGISGNLIDLTLASADADKDTMLTKGNATLHLYTDKKGGRHTDCKCDSLTIMVKNLIRENTTLKQNALLKDVHETRVMHKDSTAVSRTVVKEKKRSWITRWPGYLLAVIVILIYWFLYHKL